LQILFKNSPHVVGCLCYRKQRQPIVRKDDRETALAPSRSFSIIFRGERTLDLMTLPGVRRGEILDALDNVIRSYQASKQKVANDVLLLRYIWLDVDKVRSFAEWARDPKHCRRPCYFERFRIRQIPSTLMRLGVYWIG
jgi:hypothetical protein